MRLRALTHIAASAKELCGANRIIVVGSSSLLGTFPSLGDSGQPIETSLDADLLVEPCDDELAKMLDETLGDGRRLAETLLAEAMILKTHRRLDQAVASAGR